MTNAEYLRGLREKAVAEGRCAMCRARPARKGRRTCQHCISSVKDKQHANLAAGLCRCGRMPAPGTKTCSRCAEIAARRDQRRRDRTHAAGLCGVAKSHGPVAPGRVLCEACLARNAERTLDEYHQRVMLGLCAYIGCKLNAISGQYCPEHHAKIKAYRREYYARKRDEKRSEVKP